MGLSRKHLNTHKGTIQFDPALLGDQIRAECPEVVFCLLMGSAKEGVVKEGSDLDLALYLNTDPTLDIYSKIANLVDQIVPNVRCDLGILNNTEPVYRFEALKGRLLFARDQEQYISFFSLTCREYESQMFDYEKQRQYRKEAAHAV
jgi:predicted nucleotidyltransferase